MVSAMVSIRGARFADFATAKLAARQAAGYLEVMRGWLYIGGPGRWMA